MSTVRFIGDLHLGHRTIVKYSGEARGNSTTVEEHDAWIVQQWNSVVDKNDVVKILGDVAFNKDKLPLLKKMKGNKHLYLGNHDKFTLETYKPYFNYIHSFEKKYGFWMSHCPIHPDELRGKYNIHGHVHQKTIQDDRYINVSVEAINGRPISLEECIQKIKDRGLIYPPNKGIEL